MTPVTAPAPPASSPVADRRPVEVVPLDASTARATRLAVIIITWNRKSFVTAVLEALARQTIDPRNLNVVVVDNAGTDGTLEHLAERFKPEAIVENYAAVAHEPKFQPAVSRTPDRPNTLGLGSLTLVHNQNNFGGCGGFNTGFAYVAHAFDSDTSPARPDYLWLVDDDIDLPADAAEHLCRAMESDAKIGLVGSRTVDLNNRDTTIETTIYFDKQRGTMAPDPADHHPQAESHRAWVSRVGATRGKLNFTGLRDVDVVSACSLLARYSAVKSVGFWDFRYFIYCDDADWCLRFAKAGWRVVLNLDAVVFHTPWNHKLTPARAYYAQRNIIWVLQKILDPAVLRRSVFRWYARIAREALDAATHRRLFHAEIIRRTLADAISQRWGKLDHEGPPFEDTPAAMDRAGLLKPGSTIAVMCNRPEHTQWANNLRDQVAAYLKPLNRAADLPRFTHFVRNDLPGAHDAVPAGGPGKVVYSGKLRSKIRRQIPFLFRAPGAAVVFDQSNDFPLIRAGHNIHIDYRQPARCQIERAGTMALVSSLARWSLTCVRAVAHAATLRPYVSPNRYG